MTCEEYEKDHPYGEIYGEIWAMRRKLLRETTEKARLMVTELLIKGEDIDDDDDSQRGLIKEIVAECKPWKKTRICRINEFLEDVQEKMLTEKRYLTWLTNSLRICRQTYACIERLEVTETTGMEQYENGHDFTVCLG